MAKMQKLDPKQVPQVIALGVLTVGVFGYALFTFAGSAPKSDPTPAKESSTSSSSTTSSSTGAAGTQTAVSVVESGGVPQTGAAGAPDIKLPGQYNPDPFKSGAKPEGPSPVEVTPKAPKITPPPAAPIAPPLPDASRQALAPLPSLAPPAPVVPLGPERPEVLVTGTSVVDGLNLAILEVGQEHRVVQVGDVVSKGYRVKKIQLQGVVFGKDKDRFFKGVGAKTDPDKSDNVLDKLKQF